MFACLLVGLFVSDFCRENDADGFKNDFTLLI